MENLGKKARDKISGFEGIITAYASYLDGTDHYCISPRVSYEGKMMDDEWFHTGKVEIISEKVSPVEGTPQSKTVGANEADRCDENGKGRTEMQKRVESLLFDLITVGSRKLEIVFKSNAVRERHHAPLETKAVRRGSVIELTLVEPGSDEELSKWGDAMVRAEELLATVEKEQVHETFNPNFFKAIVAKYNYRIGSIPVELE